MKNCVPLMTYILPEFENYSYIDDMVVFHSKDAIKL